MKTKTVIETYFIPGDRVMYKTVFENGDYVEISVDKEGKLIFIDVLSENKSKLTFKGSDIITEDVKKLNEIKR